MTTKIACTSFSSHPTTRPSATGSCLQTSWAALSIIPFLYIPQYLVMREGVEERHSDWETARLVCRVWNKHSMQALHIQFCSNTFLDIEHLWMYYNRHPAIANTPCPRLNTLIANNFDQQWYSKFPPSAVQSILGQASGLEILACCPPFHSLLTDVSTACPTLTSLSFDCNPLCSQIPEFTQLILKIAEHCPKIRHLALIEPEKTAWVDDDLSKMINAMPSLTSLTLTINRLYEDEMRTIRDSSITHLGLLQCRLEDHAMFGSYLQKVTHLGISQEEDREESQLAESQEELCDLLSGCTQLTSLDLSLAVNLRDEGLAAVGACCPRLSALDLSLSFGETDFFTIAGYDALLQSCPTLTHLELRNRKVKDNQFQFLSLVSKYPNLRCIVTN
jgi:hypothetical protein